MGEGWREVARKLSLILGLGRQRTVYICVFEANWGYILKHFFLNGGVELEKFNKRKMKK